VRHVLAVSELYARLTEMTRRTELQIESFEAEPTCWWPDDRGGLLKPDAYAAVGAETYADHWWVEMDLATEHATTLKRKLATYVSFWRSGQLGPDDTVPRVLVTVPDTKRLSEIDRLIHQLPPEAGELFTVALHNDAADLIVRRLSQP
jgi:hypothetical protein